MNGDEDEKGADIGKRREIWTEEGEEEKRETGTEGGMEGGREGDGYKEGRWYGMGIQGAFVWMKRRRGSSRMPVMWVGVRCRLRSPLICAII